MVLPEASVARGNSPNMENKAVNDIFGAIKNENNETMSENNVIT